MSVVGLDLSLTSTGIATSTWTMRVETLPKHGDVVDRARLVCSKVLEALDVARPELVVLESPAFAAVGGSAHERGYLWWRVIEVVKGEGVPWRKTTPQMLKKYATGNGGKATGKDAMVLAAARRFPWFEGGNDEADALWACAMGYEFLERPLVQLPALNREALRTWIDPPVKKPRKRPAAAA